MLALRQKLSTLILLLGCVICSSALSSSRTPMDNMKMASTRSAFLKQLTALALSSLALTCSPSTAFSMISNDPTARSVTTTKNGINASPSSQKVAYRSLDVEMETYGIKGPVAMWYPAESKKQAIYVPDTASAADDLNGKSALYNHRISVKRIGQLLAGWEFIPGFVSQDFKLEPTTASVLDGKNIDMPKRGPVVLLAHGYLGSRFDLSHLAEELAKHGFICLSPEYPESLAASYPRVEGLDRSQITSRVLETLSSGCKVEASSFGIVGHSLGCGTAMLTGDDRWTRVLIAGFPREGCKGSVLWLSSMNDGAVSLARVGGRAAIPPDFAQLDEATCNLSKLPSRAALVFDRPDAPNHISFLSDGVNDAMINLLSPLLPVAKAFDIPVLDFDKYQESRDSRQTAQVVIPLVTSYLKQQMPREVEKSKSM